MALGLASASVRRIASAASWAFSASSRRPVVPRITPRLLWLVARSLWNSVIVGYVSASFCRIVRAAACSRRRVCQPAQIAQDDADVVAARGKSRLVLGDSGMSIRQLLPDHQAPFVHLQGISDSPRCL